MFLKMTWYFHVIQFQIITFLLVFSVFPTECRHNPVRIIGGKPANIRDHPYIVAVVLVFERRSVYFRGAAVIVSKRWALTAGHCIMQFTQRLLENGFVFLRGNSDVWNNENDKHRDHKVIEYHTHPNYSDLSDYDSDIAIVKVQQPFDGQHEKPVKVAGKHFKPFMNEFAMVLGWGTINFEIQKPEGKLRAVAISLFPQQICVKAYSNFASTIFTNNMICGGSLAGGKDACNGDSGGPLTQFGVLIGIVSYGINCGLREYPGVYTKLAAFHDWLVTLEKQLNTKFHIRYADKATKRKASGSNSRQKLKFSSG